MATKDISDLHVIRAYAAAKALRQTPGNLTWPDEILRNETGQCAKVCHSAMERAYDRRFIECGVSLRSGWLTDLGEAVLKANTPVDPS